MDQQQNAVTPVLGAKVSTTELLGKSRFELLKSPTFDNLNFNRDVRIAGFGPNTNIRFFLVDDVRLALDRK
jgi:hypothetical protein